MPSVYFDQDERDAYCLVEYEDGTTEAFFGVMAYELWQRTIELERGTGSDVEKVNR